MAMLVELVMAVHFKAQAVVVLVLLAAMEHLAVAAVEMD
jgi:hypothetical protein